MQCDFLAFFSLGIHCTHPLIVTLYLLWRSLKVLKKKKEGGEGGREGREEGTEGREGGREGGEGRERGGGGESNNGV